MKYLYFTTKEEAIEAFKSGLVSKKNASCSHLLLGLSDLYSVLDKHYHKILYEPKSIYKMCFKVPIFRPVLNVGTKCLEFINIKLNLKHNEFRKFLKENVLLEVDYDVDAWENCENGNKLYFTKIPVENIKALYGGIDLYDILVSRCFPKKSLIYLSEFLKVEGY